MYAGESSFKKLSTYQRNKSFIPSFTKEFDINSNLFSFIESKPLTGELRFNVPGERVYFTLKKEDCKFSEDFVAIYFEQVLFH